MRRRIGISAFIAILAASTAIVGAAEVAAPELIPLFEAGVGGYKTYRIPGVVVTKAGTILAYCEARLTGIGDWDTIDDMLRRSTDGGKTWEPARRIATTPEGAPQNQAALDRKIKASGKTTNNPVAIVDQKTGAVHFLFCVNYGRCFHMVSEDDGKTFSQPVEITPTFAKFRPEYNWKVIATGPGHGIQLASGRLMVPVWMSTSEGNNAHHPSCVSTIFSDDQGKTWNRGEIACHNTPETPDPNETISAQLSDGRVMLNIRNESKKHRRLVSISKDGATGWSTPTYDETLFEPICFASLVSIPGGNGKLVFSNPDSSALDPKKQRARENLTLRLSTDNGAHWNVLRVLEPGIAGYSDLAASSDGKWIYCLFERGGVKQQMFHTQTLTIARISTAWVENP